MIGDNIGALAAALAKAQATFPPILRDKEVDSRSYKFKYAPLDAIIAAVRPALAENGLAISQLIDADDLVTLLLHESGATLSGRMPLPHGQGETIQQLGSAITYLRRYALQAMLGIAAEEDDDGEQAAGMKRADRAVARQGFAGNRYTNDETRPDPVAAAMQTFDAGLIGTAKASGNDDFQLRQTPEGWALPFRLAEGRKSYKVLAKNALGELLAANRDAILEATVTVWGEFEDKSFTNKDQKLITYQVLNLTRLKVGDLDLSEPDAPEADDFEDGWLKPAAVPA